MPDQILDAHNAGPKSTGYTGSRAAPGAQGETRGATDAANPCPTRAAARRAAGSAPGARTTDRAGNGGSAARAPAGSTPGSCTTAAGPATGSTPGSRATAAACIQARCTAATGTGQGPVARPGCQHGARSGPTISHGDRLGSQTGSRGASRGARLSRAGNRRSGTERSTQGVRQAAAALSAASGRLFAEYPESKPGPQGGLVPGSRRPHGAAYSGRQFLPSTQGGGRRLRDPPAIVISTALRCIAGLARSIRRARFLA